LIHKPFLALLQDKERRRRL